MNKRTAILSRDGWQCRVCGSGDNLEMHHINRRPEEASDHFLNLVTLCRSCHAKLEQRGAAYQRYRIWESPHGPDQVGVPENMEPWEDYEPSGETQNNMDSTTIDIKDEVYRRLKVLNSYRNDSSFSETVEYLVDKEDVNWTVIEDELGEIEQ